MAIWYKATGEVVHGVQPANVTDFQLQELRGFVGGTIEIVRAKAPGMILVINDEGKLLGLPRNEKATRLAQLFTPETLRQAQAEAASHGIETLYTDPDLLEEPDYIAGDALYCKDEEVR